MLSRWQEAFATLAFPARCLVCGTPLNRQERCLCATCLMDLPRTHYHLQGANPVEQLFFGKVPVVRGSSYFFYKRGSAYREVLRQLKYHGKRQVGFYMGCQMAAELQPAGFFEGIDAIVPLPLHKKREKERGYNQSEWIARGIAACTKLPIEDGAVVRKEYSATQARRSAFERWRNVEGVFELKEPGRVRGKHVLLVDDVLTTGATLAACAAPLAAAGGVRISVLTLAVAAD